MLATRNFLKQLVSLYIFTIIFIDLLEDKVRNRLIYGFIVLLFYLALVLIISASVIDDAKYPTDVKTIVGMKGQFLIGQPVQNVSPAPRMKILSQQDSIPFIEVQMQLKDFISEIDLNRPSCDYAQRSEIVGSLEYIRLKVFVLSQYILKTKEICRIVVNSQLASSDERGNVEFSNFTLTRGPSGIYGFQARVIYDGMTNPPESEIQYSSFLTEVADIKILNKESKLKNEKKIIYPIISYSSIGNWRSTCDIAHRSAP